MMYLLDPQVHVQDLLVKNAKDVYRILVTESGYIYICGDTRMAADVTNTLQKILTKKSGTLAKKSVRRISIEDLKV